MQGSSPAPEYGSPGADGNLLGAKRRARALFPSNLWFFAKQDAARVGDGAVQEEAERSTLLQEPRPNVEQELEDAPLPVQPSLRPNSSTIPQRCLKVEDPI